MRTRARLAVVLGLSFITSVACGALRQNLRSQFVSYRGAWYCETAGCGGNTAVQSKAGVTKGDLRINDVKLQPHVALVFYPGTPVKDMTASVRDCKGTSQEVPAKLVQAPGGHRIASEPDSWVIWIDEALAGQLTVDTGDCAVLTVTTHSTWEDGAVFDIQGAIRITG